MVRDMLGALVRKIVDLSLDATRVLYDLVEKLSGEARQQWLAELKNFLRKENCWTGVVREIVLRLISDGQTLVLDAVDGTVTLFGAKDTFAWRDSNLEKWGTNNPGPAIPETLVEVYEMAKDATFAQIFGSLSSDLKKLCLTQHQIKNFVQKYRSWLRTEGYGTFFLFESDGEFFVADVSFSSDGTLRVFVHRFVHDDVWYAGGRPRIVVPQLAV